MFLSLNLPKNASGKVDVSNRRGVAVMELHNSLMYKKHPHITWCQQRVDLLNFLLQLPSSVSTLLSAKYQTYIHNSNFV